jgi:hypothetical protein
LIRQLLLVAVSLTFQVAILKFIAMYKQYHRRFIFNNGGSSFEALKAVTEKPELRYTFMVISTDKFRVPSAEHTADLFDKFVPFYSLGFAFQP